MAAKHRDHKPSRMIRKLMALLMAMVLLFVLVFAVVTFGYNSSYLLSVAQNMQAQVLDAQKNTASTLFSQYFEVFFSLAVDSDLRSLLNGDDASLVHAARNQKALRVIRSYISMQPDIVAVRMESPDGTVFAYSRNSDTLGKLWGGGTDPRLEAIHDACLEGRELRVFADARRVAPYGPIFHMAIRLRDFTRGEGCGFLLVTFSPRTLIKALSYQSGEGTLVTTSAIVTGEGEVIAYPDESQIGLPFQTCVKDQDVAGFSVLEEEVGRYHLKIVNVLDSAQILSNVVRYNAGMTGWVLLIMAGYITAATLVMRRSEKTVRQLLAGIEAVESGSLDVAAKPASYDEFGRIAMAFNRMVARLRETSAARESENAARIRALAMQHNAEMVAMESQINSHFLANTLNMIGCTAIEAGDHEASRLLKALASCMRYTFEKSGRPASVRGEVQWLRNYLMLQKERCGKKFDYTIHAQDSILEDPIKKLLIQPFIENSIKHGFSGVKSGGLLAIRLRRFHGGICITVYDNGRGMSRAREEAIRLLFAGRSAPLGSGIGIENVVLRVQHSYAGGKLFLRCPPGGGTKIILFLPPLEPVQADGL